jgi:hypothetical protein
LWKELKKISRTSDVIVDVPTKIREVIFHVESATVKTNLFGSTFLKYFGGFYVEF